MQIEIKFLRHILAVLEAGSYTRAAQNVHVAQSWLSTQMRKFEESVGFTVLNRTTRSVELTDEGRDLIGPIQEVIRAIDNLNRVVSDIRGESVVQIGVPEHTNNLPNRIELIETLVANCPRVPIQIHSAWDSELLEDFRSKKLDIILTVGEMPSNMADECEQLILDSGPVSLEIPTDHPLLQHGQIDISLLKGTEVVMYPQKIFPAESPIHALYDRLQAAGVKLVSSPEVNLEFARRFAIKRGLPLISSGYLDKKFALESRPLVGKEFAVDLRLVRRKSCQLGAIDSVWRAAEKIAVKTASIIPVVLMCAG